MLPPERIDTAELDKMILNYSILNGALELLPQTLASMAIIPLQMKMVYRVGKTYGYELDRGHIKDLLATLGVGLTGQYVEQIGRKLIGGLLKTVGGGLLGGLGSVATGAGFSFATTYALGQVAKQYYARRAHHRRGAAQAGVRIDVRTGQGTAGPLRDPDRAEGAHDRCESDCVDGAGAVGEGRHKFVYMPS